MRPLSSAYRKEVILCAMRKVKNERFDGIKTLVLSSPEMSDAFDIVMRDVSVRYDVRKLTLVAESVAYVSLSHKKRRCNWIAPFIQKLSIECNLDNEAISFFNEVFSYNHLDELNLCFMKELCHDTEALQALITIVCRRSRKYKFKIVNLNKYIVDTVYANPYTNNLIEVNRTVKKLMSIARKLVVSTEQMDEIPSFLSRCETVFFNCRGYVRDECKPFLKSHNSSIVLQLDLSHSMNLENCIDALKNYKGQLQHVRRFDFVLKSYGADIDHKKLIDCLSTFSPNIEEVNICAQWMEPDHDSLEDFCHSMKHHYYKLVTDLHDISQHIKANVFYTTGKSFFDGDDTFDLLDRYFPTEDFVVKHLDQRRRRTIFNRKTKLLENVELYYTLELETFTSTWTSFVPPNIWSNDN